ncbi:MAG: FAD-dependent oxidoreductase [Chloroflexota bacterium]
MRQFDAIVIGAGSGGLTAARRLSLAGKRTAIVEADRLGGDCLNWGGVPTKTLISTAKLCHQIAHAGAIGLQVDAARLDFAAVMAHVAGVQAELGTEERRYYIEEPGVEVIHGTAIFTDPYTVKIGNDELVHFEHCIIATS